MKFGRTTSALMATGAAVLTCSRFARAQQCPQWSEGFYVAGVNGAGNSAGQVNELATFDDGSGPALYIGGVFDFAGSVACKSVAKWDGASWSALGDGVDTTLGGYNGSVSAMAVFDDGSGPALFVGGNFTLAGNVAVNNIAKWDGASWTALGVGVGSASPDRAIDMLVHDDGSGQALYVTGFFLHAGGAQRNSIARWNGTSWSSLGTGLVDSQQGPLFWAEGRSLAVYDSGSGAELYVAGQFDTAGGVTARSIAKWNGASWSDVGGGMSPTSLGRIFTLETFDDGSGTQLYAGGDFTWTIGGATTQSCARWNGTAWSSIGAGFTPTTSTIVRDFHAYDDGSGVKLYAAGSNLLGDGVVRWDGATWSSLALGDGAYTLGVLGGRLFAGGGVEVAGAFQTQHIAQFDGATWMQVGGGAGVGQGWQSIDEGVRALASTDDGPDGGPALYAGGDFYYAGSVSASRVARWNGAQWSPLGAGTNGVVEAALVFDDGSGPKLYAGGSFTSAGGSPANYIASWDGAQWSPLSSGADDEVRALAVFDDGGGDALYAGGTFTSVGGVAANRIARWDGASWSALGAGVSVATTLPSVDALVVFDDGNGPALYAAGAFRMAGGLTVERIARWDGASWSALGTGLDSRALALAVYDDGRGAALYVGGKFAQAGGLAAERIAKWNGTSWFDVGGGVSGGEVDALTVYDDGRGPALFAGGHFDTASGAGAVGGFARWDGATWSGLDGGVRGGGTIPPADAAIRSFATFADGIDAWPALYAGGLFERVGNESAHHIARIADPCAGEGASYCTAGTTTNGCTADMSSTGHASRSQSSGFVVSVTDVEGAKAGTIFFGINGELAVPWGDGTSFRCVAPPVARTGVQAGVGASGTCDGVYVLDFNAWMQSNPGSAPPAGSQVRMQTWFRDPGNGSNKDTSFSDGLTFVVAP